jgi:LuxR family maltose regulon positive regulatory protein
VCWRPGTRRVRYVAGIRRSGLLFRRDGHRGARVGVGVDVARSRGAGAGRLAAGGGALPRAARCGESADVLEELGLAAFWLDDADAAIEARERAYALYREEGRECEAARVATWLAWDYSVFRGDHAVASGWLARAHRLLDPLEPGREHAWLGVREASATLGGDPARAQELGAQAAELCRALGLTDLEMNALAIEGLALVSLGQVDRGMRLLDEATAAAVSGGEGENQ